MIDPPNPTDHPRTHLRGIRGVVHRLKQDGIGLLARAIEKLLVGPLRYGKGADYSAERYWGDRLKAKAGSLRGPGHEGLSDEENAVLYAEAAQVLRRACRSHGIELASASVLDVGCGSGQHTRLCHEDGVTRYVGLDLTDVLFPALRQAFPQYSFTRKDITSGTLEGRFDLVLVLDVLEHVVDRQRLATALANVAGVVAEGGALFIALPFAKGSPKLLFYLRHWDMAEITPALDDFQLSPPVPWRDGWLLVARRVAEARPRPAPDA